MALTHVPSILHPPSGSCVFVSLLHCSAEREASCSVLCVYDCLFVPILSHTTLKIIPLCEDRGVRMTARQQPCGSERKKEG